MMDNKVRSMMRTCLHYLSIFFILSISRIIKVEVSQAQCSPAAVNTTADAKTIVDSKFDPKVVANILPYRTQKQCAEINTAIASLNSGTPLVDSKYTPLKTTRCYDDLLFALINEPMTVFSKYLGYYMNAKNTTYIIMIFIQIDDRIEFKKIYDSQHDRCFDDQVKDQQHPFSDVLAVWSKGNRADDKEDSCDQGKWLMGERLKWYSGIRTGLDGMLMKHTIKYAKNGISCYGKQYNPQPNIIEDINQIIADHDLVDVYSSLVRYNQNDNDYLVRILHDHSDSQDNFAIWILVLSIRRTPGAIEALNNAFKAAFDGRNLIDGIFEIQDQDTVFKNMLAALVDPTFKPYADPQHPPQGQDD